MKGIACHFDPGFDAGELHWYVQEVEDCKLILMEKDEDEMGKKGPVIENLRKEDNHALPVALSTKKIFSLYKKSRSSEAVLDYFIRAQVMFHQRRRTPVLTEHKILIERTVRE